MFNFKVNKVKDIFEAKYFSNEFQKISGANIPYNYFLNGESYLFFSKTGLIGGYALIKDGKRTLKQTPLILIGPLNKISIEITGYFINKNQSSFLMKSHFLFKILTKKTKHFVYAYDSSNKKLEKIYSYAKPFRLYSGLVKNLEGMEGFHYENVEVISKIGFIKIYLSTLYRNIKWKLL